MSKKFKDKKFHDVFGKQRMNFLFRMEFLQEERG